MAARTNSTRQSAIRIGVVAVAAIVVAEGAVWLMRPRAESIAPASVSERSYFSAAELRRASDYRDAQRLIGFGALAVEGGVLLVLALWRPAPLRRALDAAARRPILGAAAVGAGVSLTLAVAGLPLGAIANERARDAGLSTQEIGPWLGDQARAIAIGMALGALAAAAAMAMLRRLGRRFWLGGTVLVIGAAAAFTWLAPVVLAPVFNRFEPLPPGRVRSEVLALGRRAGVKIGQVYRVDASRRSTAINAYVDGLGSTKRVVLYDNTIRELSPAELRSVVAHELGHVKGDDIGRGLLFVALIAPLGMLFVQLCDRGAGPPPRRRPPHARGDPGAGAVGGRRRLRARRPGQSALAHGRGAGRRLRPGDDPRPRRVRRSAAAPRRLQPRRPRAAGGHAVPLRDAPDDDGADRRRRRLRPLHTMSPMTVAADPIAELRAAVDAAARALRDGRPTGTEPTLDRPPKPELGDYSSNAAMLLAAPLGEKPRDVAERLRGELEGALGDSVERIEVAGPGLRQPLPLRRLVPARDGGAGRGGRGAWGAPGSSPPSGSWSSSSPPTRPGRCTSAAVATPPTATRWSASWRRSATR